VRVVMAVVVVVMMVMMMTVNGFSSDMIPLLATTSLGFLLFRSSMPLQSRELALMLVIVDGGSGASHYEIYNLVRRKPCQF
jgi:hypothetical protein